MWKEWLERTLAARAVLDGAANEEARLALALTPAKPALRSATNCEELAFLLGYDACRESASL